MIQSLRIKNIALISNMQINLTSGLNILTGETGAGKSLIMNSISLCNGERADKSLISFGKDFAEVEAEIIDYNNSTCEILRDNGIEDEGIILIRRKIYADGKNECRVNGKAFTLSMLKTLMNSMIDVYGQFQHQSLLKIENHCILLDKYGNNEISKNFLNYKKSLSDYKSIKAEQDSFGTDEKYRKQMIDLYDYQMKEIDEADFYDGEEELLKEQRNKFQNAEKIANAYSSTLSLLSGDNYDSSIVNSITRAIVFLNSISSFDKNIDELVSRLESCKYECEDIISTVENLAMDVETNEYAIELNEKRLDLLKSFYKKYAGNIKEIKEYREKIGAEFARLSGSEEALASLTKKVTEKYNETLLHAQKLTDSRKLVAEKLEKAIMSELESLGMKSAKFKVEISNSGGFLENGQDFVEFYISLNAGEPLKPLIKTISGGEMSRFMLAIKNITADIDDIGTLVFDEIDTGISGKIAEVVGQKMATISTNHQIICVTHLSQIASFADNHMLITKNSENDKTTTHLTILDSEMRTKEIARLAGSFVESNISFQHAEEMIEYSNKFKSNLIKRNN
ncbi:MAG: DNA repair protein RecN [Clostridia bacterium]